MHAYLVSEHFDISSSLSLRGFDGWEEVNTNSSMILWGVGVLMFYWSEHEVSRATKEKDVRLVKKTTVRHGVEKTYSTKLRRPTTPDVRADALLLPSSSYPILSFALQLVRVSQPRLGTFCQQCRRSSIDFQTFWSVPLQFLKPFETRKTRNDCQNNGGAAYDIPVRFYFIKNQVNTYDWISSHKIRFCIGWASRQSHTNRDCQYEKLNRPSWRNSQYERHVSPCSVYRLIEKRGNNIFGWDPERKSHRGTYTCRCG